MRHPTRRRGLKVSKCGARLDTLDAAPRFELLAGVREAEGKMRASLPQ
jgi:hypothetical protein